MATTLKSDFEFYLRFTKPLVLNLPDAKDRVLAASWVKKLKDDSLGPEPLRTQYLKLLLFVLQRRKLAGVFRDNPRNHEILEDFPPDYNLVTIAKEILEREQEEKAERNLKRLQGDIGEFPPFSTDFSSDYREYVAAQDIPNFGVHVYYAIGKQTLPNWEHADKGRFPKVTKSIIDASGPPSIAIIKSASSTKGVAAPKEEPEQQPPESEEAPEGEPREGEEKKKVEFVEPKKEKKKKKINYGANPPIEPLGKVTEKEAERPHPTWGSNLLEVKDNGPELESEFDDDISEMTGLSQKSQMFGADFPPPDDTDAFFVKAPPAAKSEYAYSPKRNIYTSPGGHEYDAGVLDKVGIGPMGRQLEDFGESEPAFEEDFGTDIAGQGDENKSEYKDDMIEEMTDDFQKTLDDFIETSGIEVDKSEQQEKEVATSKKPKNGEKEPKAAQPSIKPTSVSMKKSTTQTKSTGKVDTTKGPPKVQKSTSAKTQTSKTQLVQPKTSATGIAKPRKGSKTIKAASTDSRTSLSTTDIPTKRQKGIPKSSAKGAPPSKKSGKIPQAKRQSAEIVAPQSPSECPCGEEYTDPSGSVFNVEELKALGLDLETIKQIQGMETEEEEQEDIDEDFDEEYIDPELAKEVADMDAHQDEYDRMLKQLEEEEFGTTKQGKKTKRRLSRDDDEDLDMDLDDLEGVRPETRQFIEDDRAMMDAYQARLDAQLAEAMEDARRSGIDIDEELRTGDLESQKIEMLVESDDDDDDDEVVDEKTGLTKWQVKLREKDPEYDRMIKQIEALTRDKEELAKAGMEEEDDPTEPPDDLGEELPIPRPSKSMDRLREETKSMEQHLSEAPAFAGVPVTTPRRSPSPRRPPALQASAVEQRHDEDLSDTETPTVLVVKPEAPGKPGKPGSTSRLPIGAKGQSRLPGPQKGAKPSEKPSKIGKPASKSSLTDTRSKIGKPAAIKQKPSVTDTRSKIGKSTAAKEKSSLTDTRSKLGKPAAAKQKPSLTDTRAKAGKPTPAKGKSSLTDTRSKIGKPGSAKEKPSLTDTRSKIGKPAATKRRPSQTESQTKIGKPSGIARRAGAEPPSKGAKEAPPKAESPLKELMATPTVMSPEVEDVYAEALKEMEILQQLDALYNEVEPDYPEGLERTPPIFSQDPRIREAAQGLRYRPEEFQVVDTPDWQDATKALAKQTKPSRYVDPRLEERVATRKRDIAARRAAEASGRGGAAPSGRQAGTPQRRGSRTSTGSASQMGPGFVTPERRPPGPQAGPFPPDSFATPTAQRTPDRSWQRLQQAAASAEQRLMTSPAAAGVPVTTPLGSASPRRRSLLEGMTPPDYGSPGGSPMWAPETPAAAQAAPCGVCFSPVGQHDIGISPTTGAAAFQAGRAEAQRQKDEEAFQQAQAEINAMIERQRRYGLTQAFENDPRPDLETIKARADAQYEYLKSEGGGSSPATGPYYCPGPGPGSGPGPAAPSSTPAQTSRRRKSPPIIVVQPPTPETPPWGYQSPQQSPVAPRRPVAEPPNFFATKVSETRPTTALDDCICYQRPPDDMLSPPSPYEYEDGSPEYDFEPGFNDESFELDTMSPPLKEILEEHEYTEGYLVPPEHRIRKDIIRPMGTLDPPTMSPIQEWQEDLLEIPEPIEFDPNSVPTMGEYRTPPRPVVCRAQSPPPLNREEERFINYAMPPERAEYIKQVSRKIQGIDAGGFPDPYHLVPPSPSPKAPSPYQPLPEVPDEFQDFQGFGVESPPGFMLEDDDLAYYRPATPERQFIRQSATQLRGSPQSPCGVCPSGQEDTGMDDMWNESPPNVIGEDIQGTPTILQCVPGDEEMSPEIDADTLRQNISTQKPPKFQKSYRRRVGGKQIVKRRSSPPKVNTISESPELRTPPISPPKDLNAWKSKVEQADKKIERRPIYLGNKQLFPKRFAQMPLLSTIEEPQEALERAEAYESPISSQTPGRKSSRRRLAKRTIKRRIDFDNAPPLSPDPEPLRIPPQMRPVSPDVTGHRQQMQQLEERYKDLPPLPVDDPGDLMGMSGQYVSPERSIMDRQVPTWLPSPQVRPQTSIQGWQSPPVPEHLRPRQPCPGLFAMQPPFGSMVGQQSPQDIMAEEFDFSGQSPYDSPPLGTESEGFAESPCGICTPQRPPPRTSYAESPCGICTPDRPPPRTSFSESPCGVCPSDRSPRTPQMRREPPPQRSPPVRREAPQHEIIEEQEETEEYEGYPTPPYEGTGVDQAQYVDDQMQDYYQQAQLAAQRQYEELQSPEALSPVQRLSVTPTQRTQRSDRPGSPNIRRTYPEATQTCVTQIDEFAMEGIELPFGGRTSPGLDINDEIEPGMENFKWMDM